MSYVCYGVFHNSQHQSWRVRTDWGVEVGGENHTTSASQHCQLRGLCTETANTSLKINIRIGIFLWKKNQFQFRVVRR